MNNEFIKNFLVVSDEVYQQGQTAEWAIPESADKNKGDLGLLPEDEKIEAWQVPPTTAHLLYSLVLINRPKTILELGTSLGFSTLWLALGARELGAHVHATEVFPEKAALAKENFAKAGVADLITLHEKDILDTLQNWDNTTDIDFVFMDADKQRYSDYFDLIFPRMTLRGVMVVDNVGNYPQYMTGFLEKMKQLEGAGVQLLDIDNGLLVITKGVGVNMYKYQESSDVA